MSARVSVEKPPIPTLWLDTSVGIKLAKLKSGERIAGPEAERLRMLEAAVIELTRAGRLLCPVGDQEDEFAGLRLDSEIAEKFAELSMGISLAPWVIIKDRQTEAALRAYVSGDRLVSIPFRANFSRDPIEELAEARRRPGTSTVRSRPPPGTPLTPLVRAGRLDSTNRTEEIRRRIRESRVSYESQLEKELVDEADALAGSYVRINAKLRAGQMLSIEEIGERFTFGALLTMWKKHGGQPGGLPGLLAFMKSPIYIELPISRIYAQLYADLVSGDAVVKSGDPGDVALLSAAIPVCHYVLTDKRMEARVKRRSIDEEWSSEVFSERRIPELVEALRNAC